MPAERRTGSLTDAAVAASDGNDASTLHDVFISYSRRDKEFARRLDKSLKGYTPPRALDVPQRHLNVFRDEEDFTGSDYHASISRHLKASRKLLVLCSPHARASKYVDEEVRRFAELRGAVNIIPLLVGGVPNNETAPEEEGQAAFPDALCRTLGMPLAIDYRGFDLRRDRVHKGAFEGAWHTTLASIYDRSRSQIEQRERRRTARRRRLTTAIASSVVAVLAAALVVTLFSWRQAVEQRTAAVARQLAAQAELVRNQRPDSILLSVLLATESLKRYPSLEAEMVLRSQLWLMPYPVLSFEDPVANAAFNPATVVFSPDRKYVATASVNDVSVWELMTGRPIARMAPMYPIKVVAFSPEGEYLVTGSGPAALSTRFVAQAWKLPDGREMSRMAHENEPPQHLSISRAGELLATIDKAILRLWDPKSGRAVAAFAHDDDVRDATFSPDGQRVVTLTAGGDVAVWDVRAGRKVISVQHAKARSVLFSPEGTSIASSGDDTRLWRIVDGREVLRVAAGGHLRFSGDGQRFTIEDWDRRTLGVYDAAGGERLMHLTQTGTIEDVNLQPHAVYAATEAFKEGTARIWKGRIDAALMRRASGDQPSPQFSHSEMSRVIQKLVDFAAFSPDASHFATADADGEVRLWRSTHGAEVARMEHANPVFAMAFARGGTRLMTVVDDEVRLWDLPSGRQVGRVPIESEPESVALSPADGQYLAIAATDDTIRILESHTGREVAALRDAGRLTAFAFSPDGTRLATGREGGDLRISDVPSGREVRRFPPTPGLEAILFSADGSTLVTLGEGATVMIVWNAATGVAIARMVQKDRVKALVLSGDARSLAASSRASDGTGIVHVWDVASGRARARVAQPGDVRAIAVSPDGRYLATAAISGVASPVRIWNLDTGGKVATLIRETLIDNINPVQFAPDGRLVAASDDGLTVGIWDPRGWREVSRVSHDVPVIASAVSPNGKFLAASLADGTVRVSLLSQSDLVVEACARLTRNLSADEWQRYLGEERYVPTCANLPSAEETTGPADGASGGGNGGRPGSAPR